MIKKIRKGWSRFRELQRSGLNFTKSLPQKKEDVECLNCGCHFDGAYCPQCGQAASTKRITVKDTLHNIFASIFAGDDVFFRTCRDLLWRPGYMVREYLYGKRSRYFRPIQMLVRMVAVVVLFSFLLGIKAGDFNLVDESTLQENVHSALLADAIRYLSSLLTNRVFSSLLMVVFCVLPFKWIYSKQKILRPDGTSTALNGAEHFYALVYLACMKMLASLFILCCNCLGITCFDGGFVDLLILIVLPIWLYRQLYDKSWLKSCLLVISAIILTLLMLALMIIFLFGIFYGIDAVTVK